MQPRHVEAGGMRGDELGFDLVERHRRGIDDPRAGRTMGEQLRRHDRAGVETDRAAREQVASAHGDEVGRARSGADEMHGHGARSGVGERAGRGPDRDARRNQPRRGAAGRQRRRLRHRRHARRAR